MGKGKKSDKSKKTQSLISIKHRRNTVKEHSPRRDIAELLKRLLRCGEFLSIVERCGKLMNIVGPLYGEEVSQSEKAESPVTKFHKSDLADENDMSGDLPLPPVPHDWQRIKRFISSSEIVRGHLAYDSEHSMSPISHGDTFSADFDGDDFSGMDSRNQH